MASLFQKGTVKSNRHHGIIAMRKELRVRVGKNSYMLTEKEITKLIEEDKWMMDVLLFHLIGITAF